MFLKFDFLNPVRLLPSILVLKVGTELSIEAQGIFYAYLFLFEVSLVGRAGFEPATARYLWPRQARMKPTMGRPLQLLRQLSMLTSSRALPG